MKKVTKTVPKGKKIKLDSAEALINRELSWLSFARRVLALVEDPNLPCLSVSSSQASWGCFMMNSP